MGIFDPSGFGFLTNLMNSIGGEATTGLNAKRPMGTKAMGQTFKGLEGAPPMVLPGGGTLPGGRSAQSTAEAFPSAELPLAQGEDAYKIGLTGDLAGASKLGSEQSILGTSYRSALSSQLDQLLKSLGIGSSSSALGAGSVGFLTKLLSGAF
jgi:hypothetical protein